MRDKFLELLLVGNVQRFSFDIAHVIAELLYY